jgi:hypothetical protein
MSKQDPRYIKTIKSIETATTAPLRTILEVVQCRDSAFNKLKAIELICNKSLETIKKCVKEELE